MVESTRREGTREESGLLAEDVEFLYEECNEKLYQAEQDLLDVVEARAEITSQFVNRVFRTFHIVKDAADFLGNDPLKRLSHTAETVLVAIREGRIEMTPNNAGALLSAVDRMKQMADTQDQEPNIDFTRESRELNLILSGKRNSGTVLLKLADDALAANVPERPNYNNRAESHRNLRVLIVEDDFTSRVILQGLLRAYGECHVAVTGKEAVDAFTAARDCSEPYDLICMDIRMPEMDGTEAVWQVRAREEASGILSTEGVTIFMTTAIRDLKTVHASYRALCDAYLFKPIDGRQLEEHMIAFGLIRRCGK